jgi:polyisoprenoid-binding protein YceI
MKRHTLIAGTIVLLAIATAVLLRGPCSPNPSKMAGTAASDDRQSAERVSKGQSIESNEPAVKPPGQAAEPMTTYVARSGSKMRIEGTANIIHPTWQIESKLIAGMMEVGAKFPTEPGQAVALGKVEAKANATIQVQSLKSVKEDGSLYDARMDEVTYEHLKEKDFKQIHFRLNQLTLTELPKSKDAPYVFEAKGEITVAGATKQNTMTVTILPTTYKGEKRLEINGSTAVKMTDFKVAPVDINLVLGHIKTGDEVKLVFKWIVGQKKAVPAP